MFQVMQAKIDRIAPTIHSGGILKFLFCLAGATIVWLLCPSTIVAQGWTEIGPLPTSPALATGTYTPPNASPFLRTWTKPVYDSNQNGLLVYFANPDCCSGTFSNAVFLYQVSTNDWQLVWSHMTTATTTVGAVADAPNAPADNHPYHAMAWDSTRGVLWKAFGSGVLGGDTGDCGDCAVSDTYKLDMTTIQGVWTEVCGNTMAACPPGPLQESTLAYDPIHDTLVLYGGLSGGTPTADTWEFTPGNNMWTQICGLNASPLPTCGPAQLDAPGLVYDATLGQFVLFGGAVPGTGSPMNTTTWLYSVGTHTWTQVNTNTNPPSSKFPAMDYVPRLGAVVLIGPEATGAHTWAFNGSQWIDLNVAVGPVLSASSKDNAGAYDASTDRFVLFLPGPDTSGDIWSLDLPSSLNVPPPSGPVAALSQAGVSFPSEPVGTTSSAQNVLIKSTGNAALTISNITITGANSGDFAETNTCLLAPSTLAIGSTCTVSFTFTPSAAGDESAQANLFDSSTTGSPQVVVLQGTGVVSGPAATLSPGALTFGNQKVGTSSAPQGLTLTSSGSAALTVSRILITGANSGDFAQTNNCLLSPATISAGASCTIIVTFTPSTAAAETATITIADNASGSPQLASLAGNETTAATFGITASPSSATVTAGQPATYMITISPSHGSSDTAVVLSCSNLPAMASCSFSQNNVTPGSSAVSSKLSILTSASSSRNVLPPARGNRPLCYPSLFGVVVLSFVILSVSHRRAGRRRLIAQLAVIMVLGIAALQAGCSGGLPIQGDTPTGTYKNIKVTATAGPQQTSTTVTLIVQ
jgi:Abnormal spindle-like microcephaly-assoc'd, ASPM-SPD-2-Hydin/Galactose oxidase, central domain